MGVQRHDARLGRPRRCDGVGDRAHARRRRHRTRGRRPPWRRRRRAGVRARARAGGAYSNEAIGPAPYWLLAKASQAFEGTRVPARFGGLVILFLALVAAGALAALARGNKATRLASIGVAGVALVACFAELPLPAFPRGLNLVTQRTERHPAYVWLDEQPGPRAILELPDWPSKADVDYRYRDWRALRYMLASKQHGHHLVNGTGRIEPMLWRRFRLLEHWSDEFFTFISAYFPVDYVLVHDAGMPPPSREPLKARLLRGTDGWREVFSSTGVAVYAIDRSFGGGTQVDRLLLRRDLTPRAEVVFSARAAVKAGLTTDAGRQTRTTLELLRDGEPSRLGARYRVERLPRHRSRRGGRAGQWRWLATHRDAAPLARAWRRRGRVRDQEPQGREEPRTAGLNLTTLALAHRRSLVR